MLKVHLFMAVPVERGMSRNDENRDCEDYDAITKLASTLK